MLIYLCHDNIFNMAEFWRQSGVLCGSVDINSDVLLNLFSFEFKLLSVYIMVNEIVGYVDVSWVSYL